MPKVKDTGVKELEDYQPGATRYEVMACLRKAASSPRSASGKSLVSKDRRDDKNGEAN